MFLPSRALNVYSSERETGDNQNFIQQVTQMCYTADNAEQNVIILCIYLSSSTTEMPFQCFGNMMSLSHPVLLLDEDFSFFGKEFKGNVIALFLLDCSPITI